uniref:Uncharacterized protein n=1 Tax=Ascaris lumbricoides TaxID=6252 RepID=A0A0M3IJY4_ASCLU
MTMKPICDDTQSAQSKFRCPLEALNNAHSDEVNLRWRRKYRRRSWFDVEYGASLHGDLTIAYFYCTLRLCVPLTSCKVEGCGDVRLHRCRYAL